MALPFRYTLSFKFLALTCSILVMGFTALEVYFLVHQRNILFDNLEARYRALVRSLASSARYGLMIGDPLYLGRLLNTLEEYPDVAFAYVSDDDGVVRASYGTLPRSMEKALELIVLPECGADVNKEVRLLRRGGYWLMGVTVCAPVSVESEELLVGGQDTGGTTRVGSVLVGISLARSISILSDIRTKSLGIVAVVAAISLGLTLLAVRLVTRPLKALTRATYEFSGGSTPLPVDIDSKDEIGELALAFNRMVERIARSQRDLEEVNARLEEMNQTLETQVEERTQALKETIRQLLEARDELQNAYAEMKQMHDVKAAFLRSASHELRTPLTAIKANIDYLCSYERDSISQDVYDMLRVVRKNINNISSMVEEILEIVRLESSQLPLRIGEVNLVGLIQECASELSMLQQEIELVMELPESLIIKGDRKRLHDLFTNLLGNAYKFTPHGGKVKVSVKMDDRSIMVEVRDTGVGIPKEHLPHIFEPFYQVTKARGGSGLGLAIVKSIVERHGGWIDVESEPGKGAAFFIWFPGELRIS